MLRRVQTLIIRSHQVFRAIMTVHTPTGAITESRKGQMNVTSRYLFAAIAAAHLYAAPCISQQRVDASPKKLSLSFLLNQFSSTNDSTRARAFYGVIRASQATPPFDAAKAARQVLRDYPTRSAAIRAGLIKLLAVENRRLLSPAAGTMEDWNGAYHGDLISAVASLRDPNAVGVLFDAISTGYMATEGLVNLGEVGLPRVRNAAKSTQWEVRRDASIALGLFADRRAELGLNAESVSQLRLDLLALTTDVEPFVRQFAAVSLRSFRDDEVRTAIQRLAQDSSDCTIRLGRNSCPAKDAAQGWLNANRRPNDR